MDNLELLQSKTTEEEKKEFIKSLSKKELSELFMWAELPIWSSSYPEEDGELYCWLFDFIEDEWGFPYLYSLNDC